MMNPRVCTFIKNFVYVVANCGTTLCWTSTVKSARQSSIYSAAEITYKFSQIIRG